MRRQTRRIACCACHRRSMYLRQDATQRATERLRRWNVKLRIDNERRASRASFASWRRRACTTLRHRRHATSRAALAVVRAARASAIFKCVRPRAASSQERHAAAVNVNKERHNNLWSKAVAVAICATACRRRSSRNMTMCSLRATTTCWAATLRCHAPQTFASCLCTWRCSVARMA